MGKSRGDQQTWLDRWWLEDVADEGPQFIVRATWGQDGAREQALDTVGMRQSGVFSDLPAIFVRHLAEVSLQVSRDLLMCKMGTQLLVRVSRMPESSADLPDLGQVWLSWVWCVMLMLLHAFLAFDEQRA